MTIASYLLDDRSSLAPLIGRPARRAINVMAEVLMDRGPGCNWAGPPREVPLERALGSLHAGFGLQVVLRVPSSPSPIRQRFPRPPRRPAVARDGGETSLAVAKTERGREVDQRGREDHRVGTPEVLPDL
jgi:hypothetical protein